MILSSQISKFGKGNRLSAYMPAKDKISILYSLGAIEEKEVLIKENSLELKKTNTSLGFSEVCFVNNNFIFTRIYKNFGVNKK